MSVSTQNKAIVLHVARAVHSRHASPSHR